MQPEGSTVAVLASVIFPYGEMQSTDSGVMQRVWLCSDGVHAIARTAKKWWQHDVIDFDWVVLHEYLVSSSVVKTLGLTRVGYT